MAGDPADLQRIFAHLCLVDPLPAAQEDNLPQINASLISRVIEATRQINQLVTDSTGDVTIWEGLQGDLNRVKELHGNMDAGLKADQLLTTFQNLDVGDAIILHISAQNAGMLIQRRTSDNEDLVHFEAFEASARSESVLAARRYLTRDFPGVSAAIPFQQVVSTKFPEEAALFLEGASMQPISKMIPKAYKAGVATSEVRDTTDPSLITDIFMGIVEALGKRLSPQVVRKHCWDSVVWGTGAVLPWRRSSCLLVLRVGIQLAFCRQYGPAHGYVYYKFLICVILTNLLHDVKAKLHPTLVMTLIAKLGRRLSKLVEPHHISHDTASGARCALLTALGPFISRAIADAQNQTKERYHGFMSKHIRKIPWINIRPSTVECKLQLLNSRALIQQTLDRWSCTLEHTSLPVRSLNVTNKAFSKLLSEYQNLAKIEEVHRKTNSRAILPVDQTSFCEDLRDQISRYFEVTGSSYDGDPIQTSYKLLTLFELWVRLDRAVLEVFPILKNFQTLFPSDFADSLQLPWLDDLKRLQSVERYISRRNRDCTSRLNVFSEPQPGCLAEQWFDSSTAPPQLLQLQNEIETRDERFREEKRLEFENLQRQYERGWIIWTANDCTNIFTNFRKKDGSIEQKHIWKQCPKHTGALEFMFLEIPLHEQMLPDDVSQMKAVIAERYFPKAFVAYRDATWQLLNHLKSSCLGQRNVEEFAWKYGLLSTYQQPSVRNVTLGSITKSFSQTHYKLYKPNQIGLPSFEDICKPNAMRLRYCTYDKLIISQRDLQVSFSHFFALSFHPSSPYASLQYQTEFDLDGNGPTSNEAIAWQTKCPAGLSVHEFKAFLALASGKERRWLEILVALGSTELNFSTEAVAQLVSRQVLQVGPSRPKEALRVCHFMFSNRSFCGRLAQQLDERISNASKNWRETTLMDVLLTITLRFRSLTPHSDFRETALSLLFKIRDITWNWTQKLRCVISNATDASSSLVFQKYARTAAIICKRTFAYHLDGSFPLERQCVRCFLEASVTLQENLTADPQKWPSKLRQKVVEDIKMVYHLQAGIEKAINSNLDCVIDAVAEIWPAFAKLRTYASKPLSVSLSKQVGWIEIVSPASCHCDKQIVSLSWVEGILLVNGHPIGNLPARYTESEIFRELFGEQILRGYSSQMQGMEYVLQVAPEGNQVHLGISNGELVVRTLRGDCVQELVPRKAFRDTHNGFDLPFALIDKCTHWLDLNTRQMEIRRSPSQWKGRMADWQLHFDDKKACRRGRVSLLDPWSATFKNIVRVFEHFELPEHITAWRPDHGPLEVRLERLSLSFQVQDNALVCKELQAKIDSNQEIGTWNGLASKLALSKVSNPRQRLVLVPLGEVTYQRSGIHMEVRISPSGFHATFAINSELGRLDSALEPSLLYLKALLHASTSTALPDQLTGRTGTEEALQCLRSGYCQPFSPLDTRSHGFLEQLASFTPSRCWYPDSLRVLEKVEWGPNLAIGAQREAFFDSVKIIRERSERLAQFTLGKVDELCKLSAGDAHLRQRALSRWRRYECSGIGHSVVGVAQLNEQDDLVYMARDTAKNHPAKTNMFEIVHLLNSWPSQITNTPNLSGLLNGADLIRGFSRDFDAPESIREFYLENGLNHSSGIFGTTLNRTLAADAVRDFGPLVKKCKRAQFKDKMHLIFFFALLAYRRRVELGLLRLFVSFAVLEDLKSIALPDDAAFAKFAYRGSPAVHSLSTIFTSYGLPYKPDAAEDLGKISNLRARQAERAREEQYLAQTQLQARALAQHALARWPTAPEDYLQFTESSQIDLSNAVKAVGLVLKSYQANLRLSEFIDNISPILRKHENGMFDPAIPKLATPSDCYPERIRGSEIPDLQKLVGKAVCLVSSQAVNGYSRLKTPLMPLQRSATRLLPEAKELQTIVEPLRDSGSQVRSKYAENLGVSLRALATQIEAPTGSSALSNDNYLKVAIGNAYACVERCKTSIIVALKNGSDKMLWLERAGMLPRMTTITLLELLQSRRPIKFGTGVREALIEYGIAITALQRLLRIENALSRGQHQTYTAEIQNRGHENWSPLQYPDWLLLEIDANFLLRQRQVEVAQATISPPSDDNSLLQLQMGQGKSLCIVPAVCTVLADGSNLVRVMVPRPLLSQTAQVMQQRLGGLVGRSVIHIPFSRRTSTTAIAITEYHKLHAETLESRGIILTIPEHVMSFKLSGQQRLSDSEVAEATKMIQVQQWLQTHSRDIMDESDHSLSPKLQLIYPGGSQTSVDGSPHRWEICQVLLCLAKDHLESLMLRYAHSLEVVWRQRDGLPFIYFLRRDVEDYLIELLVKDVELGAIPSLPLSQYPAASRSIVLKFISSSIVDKSVMTQIEPVFRDNSAGFRAAYLLRGLLVHRLLLMTLKKRWNVHYGMHPVREGLSVPFQYKGIPSDTAEWGHPDVAILFTCLSFYYSGLTEVQLRESLQLLARSDNPTSEYEHWIHGVEDLPTSLRDWNAVNAEDQVQVSQIHQHVRCSMPAINHYLNAFVFPKYAKQFTTKLQASAWDIPLFSSSQKLGQTAGRSLTTGFSGTTDGKYLFPLNIRQNDLSTFVHTDAEVLSFLLLPRNRQYYVTRDRNGKRFSELELLKCLEWQGIRVLIDAGAQIMEMDNESLALSWLSFCHKAHAAVYFNEGNKLTVIYKDRKKMPLAASPFAENLEDCVVYFAQANCRGSDVALPVEACAALTLSLGQTKDATVQAAMRLRHLGTSQSIVWFATPEVDQSIVDHATARSMSGSIDSAKVISWLLQQTCDGIESLTPLYYSQGKAFCERSQAEQDCPAILTSSTERAAYLKALRQPERQTLEQLYAPKRRKQSGVAIKGLDKRLAGFMETLDQLKTDFENHGGAAVQSVALEEVEVEREYEHEVEEIREAQRRIHFKPLPFSGLHRNIKTFAQNGRFPVDSTAGELAFNMLKKTGPGRNHGINSAAVSSKLFVTTEFARTVEIPTKQSGDNFLRQPRYLLWSDVSDTAVLVSPEEAELLLGLVCSVPEPKVHLMLYAAPLTRRMMAFNDLNFLSIPPLPPTWSAPLWLKTELGLFAGKLYFAWDEYEPLRSLLGLHDAAQGNPQSRMISERPITLVQDLLDLRRNGQDFYNTPMGYIAQGKKLGPDHAFFEASDKNADGGGGEEEYGSASHEDDQDSDCS